MLNYLISVTRDIAVMSVLVGLLYAYVCTVFGGRGKSFLKVGTAAGFAAAAVMAVLKNRTKIIDNTGGMGMWNVRIFALSGIALIVFYILCRKKEEKSSLIASISAAVLIFTFITYSFTSVIGYPFNFNLGGESYFSTAFMYRLIGYVLGIALGLVLCLAAYNGAKRVNAQTCLIFLNIGLAVNGFQQLSKAVQVLHAKRIITGHAWFALARETSNRSDLFIYAVIALSLIIPVMLLIKKMHIREPYENPAQHRKIIAKWRNAGRWSVLCIVCIAAVIINMTAFTAMANKEVELSPIEECEQRGDNLYVPLTLLEDGHLHRFAYTTEGGIEVRFIIIKKPNSSAYGVGLDACDICGETGYYERDGQVVCNLCDVVMNINTIGFKGGCNPIVIDYSVENGYITVPTYTLTEHENEFK